MRLQKPRHRPTRLRLRFRRDRIRQIEDDLDPKQTGKVFNVLGDVFPANQLERMLRDMSHVLGKARAANPDVLLIHLHSGPTALLIRRAAAMDFPAPIVAGSAMHQPPTANLALPGRDRRFRRRLPGILPFPARRGTIVPC